MDISKSGINAPMVSMSASSSSSETSSASSSSAGIQGIQASASPPVTQIVQAQLAQMQLTDSSTSASSSSLPPLIIHAPVTVRPPSSGGIKTFFQAVEGKIKSYLRIPFPYGYRAPPVTQIVQAQLAQMQLTDSSTSASSSSSSSLPPLIIHAPVTVCPPSSGGINTFFQAVEREIKSCLLASLPYDYRTPPFDKPNLCKPGFETFNKFIQINKHHYELGKAFVNKLNDIEKRQLVCRAAHRGCAALLKLARHCGVDLNQKINWTLLTTAIHENDVRAVRTLLSIGVDPNQRDGMGRTPFIVAAFPKGQVEMMQLLMQHGADINAKMVTNNAQGYFKNDMTALMMCRNKPKTMKELLSLGVDKEVRTVRGETALMLLVQDAFRLEDLDICISNIKQLVNAGANVLVKNCAGDNLLSIAITGVFFEDNSLGVTCIHGEFLELVKELIQSYYVYCNANQAKRPVKESMSEFLEIRDGRGRTPLMVAVEEGCKESALTLIDSGASLEDALREGNVSKTVRNMMEESNEDGLWDDVLQ